MATFHTAKVGVFGRGKTRTFSAPSVAKAREKVQRLSNKTGKRYDLWYAKENPMKRKSSGKRKRRNPGWVKARAVKIVRNKRGQAVSVKIRT